MKFLKIAVIVLGTLALFASCEEEVQVIEREILRDTVFIVDPNLNSPQFPVNSLPELSPTLRELFNNVWLDSGDFHYPGLLYAENKDTGRKLYSTNLIYSVFYFDSLGNDYYMAIERVYHDDDCSTEEPTGTNREWFKVDIRSDSIFLHDKAWSKNLDGFEYWSSGHQFGKRVLDNDMVTFSSDGFYGGFQTDTPGLTPGIASCFRITDMRICSIDVMLRVLNQ